MSKFNGNWNDEKVKDLLLVHKGKSHAETANELTKMWGVLITRDSVKNKYNSLNQHGAVKPEDIKSIEPIKNRAYFNRVVSDAGKKGKRRYIVTSVVAGFKIVDSFLKSLEVYCKDKDAKLVILPMKGAGTKDEPYSEDVIERLSDNFYTDYTFNSNLRALDVGLSPTSVNPLTGLQRISRNQSILIASPKQMLETIPVSNAGIPHIISSVGSLTVPDYGANKTNLLASEDHVVGCIVVEIQDDKVFHIRQVQAGEDGSFYDLNRKYSKDKIEVANILAFIPGDIHIGEESESCIKANFEIMEELKPKYVFLHDLVNAKSCSHHLQNNMSARATLPEVYRTVENELNEVGKFIKKWTSKFPSILFNVVQSNHPEHIDRWIDETRFVTEPENYRTGLELALYRLDKLNIIEAYLDKRIGKFANLQWLKRDEDFKLKDCQMNVHGDRGNNGAIGSATGVEKSYGNAFIAHSHSPKILRETFQVGTSTKLRLDYTIGATSWLHCGGVLYENGTKSLIVIIDGKWKI